MHGSRGTSADLVASLAAALPSAADVAVIPPYPYLAELIAASARSGLAFGAQDLSEHASPGAYTGEVAGAMLKEIGCRYVLVGHSERRQYHAESNELVARKFVAAVVAYEPVWAIGTGKTATPDQAQQVHAFMRDKFLKQDARIASSLCLLYGGSVKAANAAELFAQSDIDGGLIGGASLVAADFLAICHAAAAAANQGS